MQIVINWLGILRKFGQKAGPYLLLEMLLPGGTLLALLLFLYRRKKPGIGRGARSRRSSSAMRTLAASSKTCFGVRPDKAASARPRDEE